MAEALKLKEEGIRNGGGNGPGAGDKIASALGGFGEYPRRLRSFLHDVRVEMKHVNWPSRQDVWSTTVVVVITVAFFGAFFAITDGILVRLYTWLNAYMRSH
jgi:preprotein translocase subunit SecE